MPLRDAPLAPDSVSARYAAMVASGEVEADPLQRAAASRLDALSDALSRQQLAAKSSALGWLFAKRAPKGQSPKGLYIHGGVGRGKTMLMDMFFAAASIRAKRRVHFNDFMTDAHDRIQRHRRARADGTASEDDPVPPVARAIAAQARLICFDEFTVTDIADAMLLSRLFRALFAEGVVLVATSNVAPDDLYRDGLNRQLFLPFIELLKQHADILPLDSGIDYRLRRLERLPVYVTPLGPQADAAMEEAWQSASGGLQAAPASLSVMGRTVPVPLATHDAARFGFADLCEKPLGARDYLAIADHYATVFVERVPVLGEGRRNEAKRLILLVDTLYDRRIRLFMSADAEPDQLYTMKTGTEAFEFARTASRLTEMRSADWAETVAAGRAGASVSAQAD